MSTIRTSIVVLAVAVTTFAGASPALAGGPTREVIPAVGFGALPAGVACEFAVSIDVVSGGQQTLRTFFDKAGDFKRVLGTAQRAIWRITNLETGDSATFALPGASAHITVAPDGTTTVVIDGGAIFFNTPTDSPAGPFASTNVGHTVLSISPTEVTTITSLSGARTDLCALVA